MIYAALQYLALSTFVWGVSMVAVGLANAVWGAIWAGADHVLKTVPPHCPDITTL